VRYGMRGQAHANDDNRKCVEGYAPPYPVVVQVCRAWFQIRARYRTVACASCSPQCRNLFSTVCRCRLSSAICCLARAGAALLSGARR